MKMQIESSLKLLFPTIKGLELHATGSQMFGYPREDSDYDIIVHEDRKSQILAVLKQQNVEVEYSEYFDCIFFNFINVRINMIFLDSKNVEAWIHATSAMVAFKEFATRGNLGAPYCLTKKPLRYEMFTCFVKEFGGNPPVETYKPRGQIKTGQDLLDAVQAFPASPLYNNWGSNWGKDQGDDEDIPF